MKPREVMVLSEQNKPLHISISKLNLGWQKWIHILHDPSRIQTFLFVLEFFHWVTMTTFNQSTLEIFQSCNRPTTGHSWPHYPGYQHPCKSHLGKGKMLHIQEWGKKWEISRKQQGKKMRERRCSRHCEQRFPCSLWRRSWRPHH